MIPYDKQRHALWICCYFILPVSVQVAGGFFVSYVARKEGLPLGLTLFSLLLLAIIGLIICLAKKSAIKRPKPGKSVYLATGLSAGVLVSIFSAIFFSMNRGNPINWGAFQHFGWLYFLGTLPSPLMEELVCRFGIVHGVNELSNKWWAIVVGSFSFGVLHLFARFAGVPVDLQHIIGLTFAGALLSVLYLRFGLWAAVGWHFAWNFLEGIWLQSMHLPLNLGITQMEGAWTTDLAIAIALVIFLMPEMRAQFNRLRGQLCKEL